MIQNPESCLQHRKDNKLAIVVENATLSWTKPGSLPDSLPSSNTSGNVHEAAGSAEALPTLRNISFKLYKVCAAPQIFINEVVMRFDDSFCAASCRGTCLVSVEMLAVEKHRWFPAFWSRLVTTSVYSLFEDSEMEIWMTASRSGLFQMHLLQGSLTADGTFAYVSQQAWIFHGTVRENILMGAPLDQAK